MKKVLFVATVVKTHIMEFHIPYLKMFQDMGWETAVAARNDYEEPTDCHVPHCDRYYDIPFERLPWKAANFRAYRELKAIIDRDIPAGQQRGRRGSVLRRAGAVRRDNVRRAPRPRGSVRRPRHARRSRSRGKIKVRNNTKTSTFVEVFVLFN